MRIFTSTRVAILATLGLGLMVAASGRAQTTFGPGPGGTLVDASTGVGVFTSDLILAAPATTITSFQSVTLTNLTHTWVGDLEITLTHLPSGQSVILTSPPDGRSSNFNGTYTFVVNALTPTIDEASLNLTSAQNIAPGSYAISSYGGGTANGARTNYSVFNGLPVTGTWRLEISDFAAGDSGTLGSWGFSANVAVAPEPGTLALVALGIGALGVARRRNRA